MVELASLNMVVVITGWLNNPVIACDIFTCVVDFLSRLSVMRFKPWIETLCAIRL